MGAVERSLQLIALTLSFLSQIARSFPARFATDALNPYPDKPKLTFRPDGTFKITVFSDLHFGENPWDTWGPEQDANSTRLMKTVLPDEQPDYV
ncbi:hypothetical protein PQX77_015870 [Marasmius sp. AFHP31]|nr:hypothetical protein PQX77_015870 [Marasmius sp. AFHP31]